jgi:hypothetical protein
MYCCSAYPAMVCTDVHVYMYCLNTRHCLDELAPALVASQGALLYSAIQHTVLPHFRAYIMYCLQATAKLDALVPGAGAVGACWMLLTCCIANPECCVLLCRLDTGHCQAW